MVLSEKYNNIGRSRQEKLMRTGENDEKRGA
jgi:hypothetical protein